MTPARAIEAGADYLVVGRPVVEARDPKAAADAHRRRDRTSNGKMREAEMAKGYWIANVDVPQSGRLQALRRRLAGHLPQVRRRATSTRGGKTEVVEGKRRSRIVMIEFPELRGGARPAIARPNTPRPCAAAGRRGCRFDRDRRLRRPAAVVAFQSSGGNMPKGYWIAQVDVTNDEGYKPYAMANPAIFRNSAAASSSAPASPRRRKARPAPATSSSSFPTMKPRAPATTRRNIRKHHAAPAARDRRYSHHRGL